MESLMRDANAGHLNTETYSGTVLPVHKKSKKLKFTHDNRVLECIKDGAPCLEKGGLCGAWKVPLNGTVKFEVLRSRENEGGWIAFGVCSTKFNGWETYAGRCGEAWNFELWGGHVA